MRQWNEPDGVYHSLSTFHLKTIRLSSGSSIGRDGPDDRVNIMGQDGFQEFKDFSGFFTGAIGPDHDTEEAGVCPVDECRESFSLEVLLEDFGFMRLAGGDNLNDELAGGAPGFEWRRGGLWSGFLDGGGWRFFRWSGLGLRFWGHGRGRAVNGNAFIFRGDGFDRDILRRFFSGLILDDDGRRREFFFNGALPSADKDSRNKDRDHNEDKGGKDEDQFPPGDFIDNGIIFGCVIAGHFGRPH